MRKLILSISFSVALTTVVLAQQPEPPAPTPFILVGVKAGANLTKIDGQSFAEAYRLNYLAGGYITLNSGNLIGVQAELLFSQTSATTSTSFTDLYTKIGTIDLNRPHLSYMDIPLLLNIGGDELKFQLGPQYSILMNSNESFWTNGRQAFTNGDFAFDLGVWINLPLRLSASVRYVIGLDNINDIDDQDSWKTEQLQIAVGFRL
jgi:hypothetical protein